MTEINEVVDKYMEYMETLWEYLREHDVEELSEALKDFEFAREGIEWDANILVQAESVLEFMDRLAGGICNE